MSWYEKLIPARIRTDNSNRKDVPEGVWTKCPVCHSVLFKPELDRHANVCPKCNHHMRLGGRARLNHFLDEEPREEIAADLEPADKLKFKDTKKYKDRLTETQKKIDEKDALVVMKGQLHGLSLVAGAFEFSFMGGSMGAVVGEKFVCGANVALDNNIPYVCFTASGGARMQEGLTSLMQMAKTSAVLTRMREKKLPYIVVLTDPTTGGVAASLAMLGNIIIAEPNALIGLSGPRVIEQTIRETLPEGFQRSEFLLQHGAVDMILDRRELRTRIANILATLTNQDSPIQYMPALLHDAN